MAKAERKSFSSPDETRTFEKGKVDLVEVDGKLVARLTLEPGWKGSEHVNPTAGTEWCEVEHFHYHVSGRMHIVMSDGTEFDVRSGEISALPRGHDAWVVGDEPVVLIDWEGARDYAKH